MPLDPQAVCYLRELRESGIRPLHELTPTEARAYVAPAPQPVEAVAHVYDRTVPGPGGAIPVRIYQPQREGGTARSVIVYLHGGGWVQGSLDSHDGLCRSLANAAESVVVSVNYRLAPEHKYPAAVDDAYAATAWAAEAAREFGVGPGRVVVAGDSAGGNLAAAMCLMARDRGGPAIAGQLLLYPITDAACDTDSYREFADGYFLTAAGMRWFWRHYLRDDADGGQPYASPLRAEVLRGLPPAIVLTAEYDVLRDEGERYAARLAEAGVPVELRHSAGMLHGFLRRPDKFDQASRVIRELGKAVVNLLSESTDS